MTKDVVVTIEGLQLGDEPDRITVRTDGIYQFRNGKHFIRYEEMIEGVEGTIKNRIKIAPDQIAITKRGAASTVMTFDINEVTNAAYHTPYGNLQLQIKTIKMHVEEGEDEIIVNLNYTISANGERLSENWTKIKILSK
ncbi:MAG: DUF1934 domain-containing protein [Lachnospiraceae bacterium]|jgi:uncharacterized beta-barrel protein YwiB (DUF1934 family)|nr:DUF1934 domain-containing protein [Lachnospiraceae bacterium]